MSEASIAADKLADQLLLTMKKDDLGYCIETANEIRMQIKVAYLAGYADALRFAREDRLRSLPPSLSADDLHELSRRKYP